MNVTENAVRDLIGNAEDPATAVDPVDHRPDPRESIVVEAG